MSRVTLSKDGVYRWAYDLDLLKDRKILYFIFRLLGYIFLAEAVIVIAANFGAVIRDVSELWHALRVFVLLWLFMDLLAVIAYFIYAKMIGGHYRMIFEMDERGLKHTQLPENKEGADMLMDLEMLIASGSPDPFLALSGMLAKNHVSLYTSFARVKKIRTDRRDGFIQLNAPLSKNMLWVCPEDYPMVEAFIRERVPNKEADR